MQPTTTSFANSLGGRLLAAALAFVLWGGWALLANWSSDPQHALIAGLLQDDITDNIEGLPGLKDIPILGALFRSTSFQKKETELVISVTPYLIRPISQLEIALPTDGFAPASDFDRYLLGRFYKVYSKDSPSVSLLNTDGLMGPVGYIME